MHIRLHHNSINKDSGVEIPAEAWILMIKKYSNGKAVCSGSLVEHFLRMHHEYHCLRRTNDMGRNVLTHEWSDLIFPETTTSQRFRECTTGLTIRSINNSFPLMHFSRSQIHPHMSVCKTIIHLSQPYHRCTQHSHSKNLTRCSQRNPKHIGLSLIHFHDTWSFEKNMAQ